MTVKIARTFMAALLAAAALAGCSSGLFGSKKPEPTISVDANIYPANYRNQIANLLRTLLRDRADFTGALIAPPALKPVAESANPHYVVCVQLNGRNFRRDKVAIFLAGEPTQFINATPQQCGDAAYQPFPELANVRPEG